MKPRLRWLLVALSVLVLLAAGLWLALGDGSDAEPPPDELSIGPPLSAFTLTTQAGDDFHSSSLDGQVWVASYFLLAAARIAVSSTHGWPDCSTNLVPRASALSASAAIRATMTRNN